MQNFTFYLPTEIVFGRDTELCVGQEVRKHGGTKVLLVYGGRSAKESGLLDRVKHTLADEALAVAEWGGAQPNPRLDHAEAGVELALQEQVDFILAVGGGSVIDTAKAIAHGTANP